MKVNYFRKLMASLGLDLDSFPANYSDAYAAMEIFEEAQNSIDAQLSPKRFDCHMIDYMYTYLTENQFNCGMKIWAKQVWYRYRLKICLLGTNSSKGDYRFGKDYLSLGQPAVKLSSNHLQIIFK